MRRILPAGSEIIQRLSHAELPVRPAVEAAPALSRPCFSTIAASPRGRRPRPERCCRGMRILNKTMRVSIFKAALLLLAAVVVPFGTGFGQSVTPTSDQLDVFRNLP